jgi:heme/copper-type cytochrome/quinol oxidase subunit 2
MQGLTTGIPDSNTAGRVTRITETPIVRGLARVTAAALPLWLALAGGARAAEDKMNALNMPIGVTAVGESIFDLHMTILWICVIIGLLVFGVMFYSIIYHRKSRGVIPAQFHESTKVEIAWTVVPFLILIGMAVPATSTLLEIYDFEDAEMDILVTGYQWKWKYEYLAEDGENVSFFSNLSTPQSEIYNSADKNEHYLLEVDEPIVIPVDTKVRFLVTANDVIHSFWVPELAVKKDAIPGFINETSTKALEEGISRSGQGDHPLALHHQPQGHRFDVPVVQLRHVARRRRHGADHPRRAVPARPAVRRAELLQPDDHQPRPHHGLRRVMPAFVGLANWMIPMMIGAPDMALPRMNNLSFWILPFAFGMLISTLFMESGGPNFGWTFYAPLSTTYAPAVGDLLHLRRPPHGRIVRSWARSTSSPRS